MYDCFRMYFNGFNKENYKRLSIPTIGIGSSVHCNGPILVINDILGYESSSKNQNL